jgi:ribosomal-protein-alanine N-acetyltransferase
LVPNHTKSQARPQALKGEDVSLEPLRDEDAVPMFRWINDRSLVELNAPFEPVSEESHRRWFEEIRNRLGVRIFGIRLSASDALIGSCQLLHIVPQRGTCELQVRIGEASARGRGYGTEAVRLLTRHAFDDLGLHRVEPRVFETNEIALRTFEKAGFVREGVLREYALVGGERVGLVIMGRLRTD